MKLILAKIIYYVGIVAFVGVGLGMFGAMLWFTITTIPFFLAILAGFAVLIGFGMLFGWAEGIIKSNKNPTGLDR
jgi:hypothetical protein